MGKPVRIEAQLKEKFTIESDVRGHRMIIDQSEKGGGLNLGPSPLEYMMLSLAGCLITIGKIVAHQRRIELRDMRVEVEGDLDPAVLLGKRDDKRAGFTEFRVKTYIDADMTHEEKVEFLHEVDRRCPVSDNFANESTIKLEVAEEELVAA